MEKAATEFGGIIMRRDFGALQDYGAGSFQTRLMPGESILWRGAPGRGILLSRADIFVIPFSVLWCGIAISGAYSSFLRGASLPSSIFGMAFVCFGLYLVFGRLLIDAWLRRHIAYAVTNRRILIDRRGLFPAFTSVDLAILPDIQLSGNGKKGTLRFGAPVSANGRFLGLTPAFDPVPQFLGIEEPDKVLALITKAVDAARKTA